MGLIVTAAVRFEAEPVLNVLNELGPHVSFFELGIGPLFAAKSEAELARICKGRHVLYVGSCGSFYPFQSPYLITIDKVFWLPPCIRTGIADCVENLYPPFSLPSPKLDLPVKSLLTSPSISLVSHFAPNIREAMPPRTSLVENMELYACVQGLLNAKSVHTILGVTNEVGPMSRIQWKEHYRKVAQMTADFVKSQYKVFHSLANERDL